MKKIIMILLIASVMSPAFGAKVPIESKVDSRIKNVNYNKNDVYVIHGHYGYSTHIVFDKDEVIEHLSPGDSIAWQFNPKKNHLFLQPVEDRADTNLSVMTNKRMYNFELRAGEARSSSDPSLSFVIQFHYPHEKLQRQLKEKEIADNKEVKEQKKWVAQDFDPARLNFMYSMRGSDEIAPSKVFDDGQFTYFQFEKNTKTPAIFLVDSDKSESLVNYHVKGQYVVVQSTGAQFILRENKKATCIFNDASSKRGSNEKLAMASGTRSIVLKRFR